MTSYPAWKKYQVKNNWKNLISVFLTITFLFALFNGFLKGISLKEKFSTSRWDGKSPFAVVLAGSDPVVALYQNDPQKLTFLKISGDTYVETDSLGPAISKLRDVAFSGERTLRLVSRTFGADFQNFAQTSDLTKINESEAEEVFKDFASILTPLKILTGGYKTHIENTNITRIDALRLWWQLKGLGIRDVNFKDLSHLSGEIVTENSEKVLGADSQSLNKEISKYLENLNIARDNLKILISNQSGEIAASGLAYTFVKSVGANVVEVRDEKTKVLKTQILANDKNSYTASYLAKMFNCDINGARETVQNGEILVVLGQDFAKYWFE